MVINMICSGEEDSGYSLLETTTYSASMLSVTLPSKPKLVIVALRSGSIVADGMFAYATLDPETDTYVAAIQTQASGGTVTWTDVSTDAEWDDDEKIFSTRVCSGSTSSGNCTYHAVGLECEEYTGSYTVTPAFTAQTLATNEKLLTQNVSVLAIPYTRVENASGGDTLSIG